jgi:phosphogluconate dehydratase
MSLQVQAAVAAVTSRIIERSRSSRQRYLAQMHAAMRRDNRRSHIGCGNLAHGMAAAGLDDKNLLAKDSAPNLAIVTAYNDMLSAHQPYANYPHRLKQAAHRAGAVAQVAGGVPAMCDGVTQGREGMDLSLFSRDVIALSTALALSHDLFDGVLCLGICDKIVPGLLIGALRFGHLPVVMVPSGPMPSGISNAEKARAREQYAQGSIGREQLLQAEAASYHSPGTCTFYGTANSNQLLLEAMGLQLPGSAFVLPNTPLRDALTDEAVATLTRITHMSSQFAPLCEIVSEKAIVNAMVALLASGGSTNHAIHLVAIARAAGIVIDWQDLAQLSAVVPTLCRIYPNGDADINAFHAAGGTGFLIRELRDGGFLHDDILTILGMRSMEPYTQVAGLQDGALHWRAAPAVSGDTSVLRGTADAFGADGGLKLVTGNLGRAIIKTSAISTSRHRVVGPARVFHAQQDLLAAFDRGELEQDFIAVVRFQGPLANGMPELHSLTPTLAVLQKRGFKVALVTDGRMSGASGKVPAAIHVVPEAAAGGEIARIRDGDIIELDADMGRLQLMVDDAELRARAPAVCVHDNHGVGRELFGLFRANATAAEQGATIFDFGDPQQFAGEQT